MVGSSPDFRIMQILLSATMALIRPLPIQSYFDILARPTADDDLPSFVWIDPGSGGSGLDEHPENNIQKGAAYVKTIIDALMNSPAWHDSIFILAYDEGGGLYDHVPPFTVVPPDNTPPQLGPNDLPGDLRLADSAFPLSWSRHS